MMISTKKLRISTMKWIYTILIKKSVQDVFNLNTDYAHVCKITVSLDTITMELHYP